MKPTRIDAVLLGVLEVRVMNLGSGSTKRKRGQETREVASLLQRLNLADRDKKISAVGYGCTLNGESCALVIYEEALIEQRGTGPLAGKEGE